MRVIVLAIVLACPFVATAYQPLRCSLAVTDATPPGPENSVARRRALQSVGFSQVGHSDFFVRDLVLLQMDPMGAVTLYFGEVMEFSVDGVPEVGVPGAAGWTIAGDLVRRVGSKTTWFAKPTSAQLLGYPRSFVVERVEGSTLTLTNGLGTWVIRGGVAEFTAGVFHEGAD